MDSNRLARVARRAHAAPAAVVTPRREYAAEARAREAAEAAELGALFFSGSRLFA